MSVNLLITLVQPWLFSFTYMIIVEISITAALMIASFHSSVPASHDIVTMSQREQHKDTETAFTAFIVIFNACVIATVTCKKNHL